MLKTAIQLLLQDGDLVFDNFRSTINKILSGDISQQSITEYSLVKAIHQIQIRSFCDQRKITIEEQLHYDILEMCLFFNDDFVFATPSQLANIFKIDPLVKKFAEHHVMNNGIWAKLKYQIPITNKLDVMRTALLLCE